MARRVWMWPRRHVGQGVRMLALIALLVAWVCVVRWRGVRLVRELRGAPHVTLWSPDERASCAGSFAALPATHSPHGFPLAVVRDAALDYRAASRREAVAHWGSARPFERVVLYVTAHLSVELVAADARDDARPRLMRRRRELDDVGTSVEDESYVMDVGHWEEDSIVEVNVNYVIHVTPFLLKRGPYFPGKRNQRGQEVSEWQVIVSLAPAMAMSAAAFHEYLREASRNRTMLSVPIGLKHFDRVEPSVFNASLSLACFLGWEEGTVGLPSLSAFQYPRPACDSNSLDSVALGCNALHGEKAQDPALVREVAHFAARSLAGTYYFDTVALPIVPRSTVQEAMEVCHGNMTCLGEYRRLNALYLRNIVQSVEDELEILGVNRALFHRLVLLPMCRLGSHHTGDEAGSPCKSSHKSGQYVAVHFMYNLVGSSFRWSASYDIDEYIAPGSTRRRKSRRRAGDLFDSLNRRRSNALRFIWLNFNVQLKNLRPLTRDVLERRVPRLISRDAGEYSTCYSVARGRGYNGKCALKCDNGLGFTIHSALQLRPGRMLNESSRGARSMRSKVRLWHPRMAGSLGKCEYSVPD